MITHTPLFFTNIAFSLPISPTNPLLAAVIALKTVEVAVAPEPRKSGVSFSTDTISCADVLYQFFTKYPLEAEAEAETAAAAAAAAAEAAGVV